MSIQKTKSPAQTDDFIRIQDLLYLCLAQWKWFILSVAVVISFAVLYLLITPPIYLRSASILIKEDSKGASIGNDVASMFSDLGLSQGKSNVNNELLAIQSPAVALETGKRLALDVEYYVKGTFHREALYASTLPIKVSFCNLASNESVEMTVKLLSEGNVELSNFVCDNADTINAVKGKLNDSIPTPLGKVYITSTPYYEEYMKKGNIPIYVTRTNLYDMTDNIRQNLVASINDEKATVIDLTYKDILPQRAEDILNTLILVYRENWMNDKNQMTVSTSLFITDRLGAIERELGDVDEDISSYKSEHLLPDIETASSMYMAQTRETNNRILDLNTQLSMARYIRNYLTGNTNRNQLLPVNSGIESRSVESQISEYNTIQLQRNNLVANSSEENPLVIDMDQSLIAMRKAIISSIDNLIVTLNAQITDLQQDNQQTTAQIAANPNQAKYLMSVGRQQKVKEALYLFLLQKREENELSQAFTAYNTRLLTPPSGNLRPISPQRSKVLLAALTLGLVIPLIIIILRENMNTRVRGRKDLESVTVPFIGEIPLYARKKKGIFGKKSQEVKAVVVKEGSRDIINEAFRVLRTNLEFMTGKDKRSNVIVVTSFNPGSGKSFLTMNIAVSFAIKGKKVLVIDGDLRHGSASSYIASPTKGLSDYLGGRIDNLNEIIVSDPKQKYMDILPVGTIPPNPTELLFDERLKQVIGTVREQYEYVLIDCPPIELVADTQIIEKLADRTIFVVRAGLLERSMLAELEKIYEEKKYKNMSLILNGTEGSGGRYGYCYGYHYGYGSGYHYGSDEKQRG